MISRPLLVLALIALLTGTVGAEPLQSIPNPRGRDGTWVTDMPGVLRAETIAQLNSTISDFQRTTGGEMAVVVIRSLDGSSIEETAVKLFELWGIGKKDQDNGLLLLWSTGDRRGGGERVLRERFVGHRDCIDKSARRDPGRPGVNLWFSEVAQTPAPPVSVVSVAHDLPRRGGR